MNHEPPCARVGEIRTALLTYVVWWTTLSMAITSFLLSYYDLRLVVVFAITVAAAQVGMTTGFLCAWAFWQIWGQDACIRD